MRIQQTQNTNFNASKVSTTMRYSKKGAKEMIEVFKLNPIEDKTFIQKCNLILSKKHKRELLAPQKRFKDFCKEFLNKSGLDKEYFLAIKNEELISGGLVTIPHKGLIYLLSSFSIYPKTFNTCALLRGLVSDTKTSHQGFTIDFGTEWVAAKQRASNRGSLPSVNIRSVCIFVHLVYQSVTIFCR